MGHVLEEASSGRSKCRGCAKTIGKGELRVGERLPNPFSDKGDMTLWFHPQCAAYKRPPVLVEALDGWEGQVDGEQALRAEAALGLTHARLPRIDGAERASSGRARCRHCKELIDKGGWRLRLVYYQEGRFEPSGFMHLGCSADYFGTAQLLDRILCFSVELGVGDQEDLAAGLAPHS